MFDKSLLIFGLLAGIAPQSIFYEGNWGSAGSCIMSGGTPSQSDGTCHYGTQKINWKYMHDAQSCMFCGCEPPPPAECDKCTSDEICGEVLVTIHTGGTCSIYQSCTPKPCVCSEWTDGICISDGYRVQIRTCDPLHCDAETQNVADDAICEAEKMMFNFIEQPAEPKVLRGIATSFRSCLPENTREVFS